MKNYKFLDSINESRSIDEDYLISLYDFYEKGSKYLGYEVNIDLNDFKKIFSTIDDVLKLKLDEKEVRSVNHFYLTLLMADARDGVYVDNRWFVDRLWYLCVGNKNKKIVGNYKDCVPFIQEILEKILILKRNLMKKLTERFLLYL